MKLQIIASTLLLSALTLKAQTVSTPNIPSPANAPCSKSASTPPHKPTWLETKTRAFACKQNKNLCDLPSSTAEITGETPEAKPCPTTAPPKQVAPSTPQTQQTPNAAALPASPVTNKPTYVCPPNTILIPNHPYCLTADHSLVDAIPLPPGLTVPVSPAKTPAQTTTKQ